MATLPKDARIGDLRVLYGGILLNPEEVAIIEAAGIQSAELVGVGYIAFPPSFLQQGAGIPSAELVGSGAIVDAGITVGQPFGIPSGELVGQGRVYRWGELQQTAAILSAEVVGAGAIVIPPVVLYAASISSAETVGKGNIVRGATLLGQTAVISSAEMVGTGGAVIRSSARRRRPFLQVPAPQDQLTPAELEEISGVPAVAFDSFNQSIPHWQLWANVRKVAAALGVDSGELRSVVSRARQDVIGRPGAMADDFNDDATYRGIRP